MNTQITVTQITTVNVDETEILFCTLNSNISAKFQASNNVFKILYIQILLKNIYIL